jgi:hypothetical protein
MANTLGKPYSTAASTNDEDTRTRRPTVIFDACLSFPCPNDPLPPFSTTANSTDWALGVHYEALLRSVFAGCCGSINNYKHLYALPEAQAIMYSLYDLVCAYPHVTLDAIEDELRHTRVGFIPLRSVSNINNDDTKGRATQCRLIWMNTKRVTNLSAATKAQYILDVPIFLFVYVPNLSSSSSVRLLHPGGQTNLTFAVRPVVAWPFMVALKSADKNMVYSPKLLEHAGFAVQTSSDTSLRGYVEPLFSV